jgi:hypothetical protein
MDRTELSGEIIQEMGELFVRELTRVAPELMRGDLDGIEQQLQMVGRRVLGRVAERVVAAVEESQLRQVPHCESCGKPMRLVDEKRPRVLQGLVGEYAVRRAYFHCDGCHQGYAPLDERLGLGSGSFSPGLARVACRLGIEKSFPQAAEALGEALHMVLSDETMRRVTEGIGQVAEAEQQAAMARAQGGQEPVPTAEVRQAGAGVLAVEVDGAMVHLQKEWHEVKVGVVAPLGPGEETDKDSGRVRLELAGQSYCAGLEPAELFWHRVYAEACRRGLGTRAVSLVVVLGDGAEWIWRHARQFLDIDGVQVVEIVDIFHAFEHLWQVGGAVYGTGSAEAAAWVKPLKRELVEHGARPVLQALGKLVPENEEGAEEMRKALGYFTENAARMDYPSFIALKLPIGSGAVEGACKSLIQEREKGAGMRWSGRGAQGVATLRALHRSGRWREFWQTHPQRRRLPAIPGPRPATIPRCSTASHHASHNYSLAA